MAASRDPHPLAGSSPGAGGWWLAGATVLGVAAVLGTSFRSMAEQWWSSSTYSYGFLILPIALFLAWRARGELAGLPVRPSFLAIALAVPVAALWAAGQLLGLDVVHQLAAVALMALGTWAVLGTARARVLMFPLAYLFLMVPFGEFLVPFLMQLTADVAVLGVRASGVPVYQDGYVFSLPSGDFEVIKACSGIRFLMATVAAGLVFAYVAFRSWRRRLVFLALCLVIPVVANLVRAYGVVMLVHLSDMRFAAGGDHIFYGTLFFGAVLVALFVLAARWAEPSPPVLPAASSAPPGGSSLLPAGSYGAALALVVICGAALAGPALLRSGAADANVRPLPGLPLGAEPWRGPLAGITDWEPRFTGALREDLGSYVLEEAGGDEPITVDAYVVSYGWAFAGARGAGDLVSSANRLYQEDRWRPVSPPGAEGILPGSGRPYGEVLLRGPGDEGRVLWYWYRVNGERTLATGRAKWLELRAIPAGRGLEAGLVAVSTRFQEDPAPARQRLARFLADTCREVPDCVLAP